MVEPFKINRVLPPHELNARRNRKRSLTTLPGVAQLDHPPACKCSNRPSLHDAPSHPACSRGLDGITSHE